MNANQDVLLFYRSIVLTTLQFSVPSPHPHLPTHSRTLPSPTHYSQSGVNVSFIIVSVHHHYETINNKGCQNVIILTQCVQAGSKPAAREVKSPIVWTLELGTNLQVSKHCFTYYPPVRLALQISYSKGALQGHSQAWSSLEVQIPVQGHMSALTKHVTLFTLITNTLVFGILEMV